MVTNGYNTATATSNYDTSASILNTITLDTNAIKSNITTAATVDMAAVDAYTIKSNYATTQVSSSSILTTADAISEYVQSQLETKNKTETVKKENNKMDNKIFNFDFGPLKSDNVRMSMYGLAVKNRDGNYVAWDKANESILNVDILNFNGDGLMYKMPVPIKDIKDGDIIIHNRVPMFVVAVHEKTLGVIDIYSGESKTIILSKSPFGFDFATKVISIIDFGAMSDGAPSEDNPFGSMWPFLMLNGSDSIDPMMLALMYMGKGDNTNPMMMYALMAAKGNNNNLLPLMFMMNGGKFGC